MASRLVNAVRARLSARKAWCVYCEKRPRVELAGGERRYCSPECAAADEQEQVFGM